MTTYKLDVAGFHENLLNAGFMVEEMRKRAEAGKAFAEATAPVETGHFKESLSAEAHAEGGAQGSRGNGKRAVGILSSNDPAALSIEFGHSTQSGEHVEGHYTLTRALDIMGA